ncbi:MAG: hypothetical protein FWG99_02600 [Treponema sp.]|nr:hypothetical protein [Treponema sp.]
MAGRGCWRGSEATPCCSDFRRKAGRQNREIDFIVENDDGSLLGVEVKAGHSVSKSDLRPQEWFAENILKTKKPYTGIILYSGDRTIRFAENLLAVPTAALWLE